MTSWRGREKAYFIFLPFTIRQTPRQRLNHAKIDSYHIILHSLPSTLYGQSY
jgi:hypothetical protein